MIAKATFLKAAACVMICCASGSALAWTSYLVSQWVHKGDQFCKYDNGTILSMGVRLCPMTIKG